GKVSLSEFKAGNYLNLVAKEEIPSVNYRSDEASLPRKSDLIEKAKYKILFLQGEWDNQTPAYFTQSIEMANINKWKKTDLKFVYFPKAGHELDPRDSYNDIFSRKIPSETLKKISEEIKGFLN
ncbi:MAG TPA: acyl-CoA thioester hydrolase/BAAT C-terminal domain-containing protein, partial [Bdellovibrio sp.]|nr:acyl-CoA thioester hydrolase/BAAT C-terminal domain-containing protein [Bdellovibrio sp.]